MRALLIAAAVLLAILIAVQVWRALDSEEAPLPSPPPSDEVAPPTVEAPPRRRIEPISSERLAHMASGFDAAPIRGRVIDQEGRPVGGVGICVSALEGRARRPEERGRMRTPDGVRVGEVFRSLPNGHFSLALTERGEAWIGCLMEPGYVAESMLAQKVSAPIDDLVIRVRTHRYATINVRVRSGSGEKFKGWQCVYSVEGKERGSSKERQRRCAVFPVLPEGKESVVVRCRILGLAVNAPEPQEVIVRAGDTVALDFWIDHPLHARGLVRDAEGHPVEGAMVFFGDPSLARNEGIGEPRESPPAGGVLTDASGRFELLGDRARIAAFKEGHSPASAEWSDWVELTLPPAGAIEGQERSAGLEVTLGGHRRTRVESSGRYRFEEVAAGLHVLSFGQTDRRTVVVKAGETARVENPAAPVVADLVFDDEHFRVREGDRVTLVGRDGARQMRQFEISLPVTRIEGLEPGRYWFCHPSGCTQAISVEGGREARVKLWRYGSGPYDIRPWIEGPPGARYAVVPSELEETLYPLMRRLSRCRLPASGEARLSHVDGRRSVLLHDGGAFLMPKRVAIGMRVARIPR